MRLAMMIILGLGVASCGESDGPQTGETKPEGASEQTALVGAADCAPLQRVSDVHHDTYFALAEDSSWPLGRQVVLDGINGMREPIADLLTSSRSTVRSGAKALEDWLEPAIDAARESPDLNGYIEYMSEAPETVTALAVFHRLAGATLRICGFDLVDESWTSAARSFTDATAHVAYELPTGWSAPTSEGLIEFFTSISTHAFPRPLAFVGHGNSLFAVGAFETTFYDPETQGLQAAARDAAVSFGGFFAPYEGHRETDLDEAITLDGQPAWHIRYRIVPASDDDPSGAIIDFVAFDAPISLYFLGVVAESDPQRAAELLEELGDIYESADLLPR